MSKMKPYSVLITLLFMVVMMMILPSLIDARRPAECSRIRSRMARVTIVEVAEKEYKM
jgi:hypothetical protein